MSVSINSDFGLNVESVIKQGLQLAGLLPLGQSPRTDQMSACRDILNARLAELQAKGVILATTERATIALSSGVSSYDLPSDTVDVTGMGMVSKPGTTIQTPLYPISWENYQKISDKAVTGTPTQMYVEKSGAVVRLLLWTVPTDSSTLAYRRVRLFKNTDSGGVNPDVWARQLRLLALYMAHDLAMAGNLPQNKIDHLFALVLMAEKTLLGDATEKGDTQFYLETRLR